MKIIVFVVFSFATSLIYSQWTVCDMSDYLTLVNKNKQLIDEKKSFSFECVYQFFENFETATPSLEYKSVFIQNSKNDIYFEQFGKTTMQDEKFKLIFDSTENQIVITERDSLFQDPRLFEAENYNDKKSKIKKLSEKQQTKFYFELPKGQKYQGVEIWLDTKGFLIKMIMYAAYEIEKDDNNSGMIRPRLEILFKNYKVNAEPITCRKIDSFMKITGEDIKLLDKYKDFELIDLRKKI